MAAMTPSLETFSRIVVKIGSSLLVDAGKGLREDWLAGLAQDIAALAGRGADVIIVSSGAIALGRNVLKLRKRALVLEESQAAAAVGQIALAHAYKAALGAHGLTAAQVLLTLSDTEERRRYLNARTTIETLIAMKAVPVINENDTVATNEIRYGDNDRLAARVAAMAGADCLVLLSDVDGLYSTRPDSKEARFIEQVEKITPEIEAMAGDAGSDLSRGGMVTKLEAGRIALGAGCHMAIASGRRDHPVAALAAGGRATWFIPSASPVAARKTWIAGSLKPNGSVTVDDGAVKALCSGKSLLPAGVTAVEGRFLRGDAVIVRDAAGKEIARGLTAYDMDEARRIAGRKSGEIADILGYAGRSVLIHRDDLVLKRD